MRIQYFEPLANSFDRMKHALFNPMDLRKWFVMGFAAFLAGLTDAQFNGSFFTNWKGKEKPADVFSLPQNIWEWLQQHPVVMIVIAIAIFLPLLTSNFLYFIGFAFFLFFLALGIGIALILAGCATCCIGFVLLMIPYINAVILLPVSYTLRAFSIEFLGQFGPEYQVFPRLEETPPDTQPIT